MANIILIAAIGKNRELGENNDLIWNLKEDLRFFRDQTIDHVIVMGYKTYLSLPRLLPRRKHIVLTHHEIANKEVEVYEDFDDLLKNLNTLESDVYIIGGASIYREFLPYANELVLTEIGAECSNADVYFPDWKREDYEREEIDEVSGETSFKHVRYKKKNIKTLKMKKPELHI